MTDNDFLFPFSLIGMIVKSQFAAFVYSELMFFSTHPTISLA